MRSPFPGMDPYLEREWDDVHNRLCTHVSGALQPHLPRGLKARSSRNIKLEGSTDDPELSQSRKFEGDTVLVATSHAARRAAPVGSAIASIEPIVLEVIPAIEREQWVQIIDTSRGDRVVTVIEFLSPGNKLSGGLNRRYRAKLNQYIRAGVNIVEIDLLRLSRARLRVTTADVPVGRRAAYYTCLNRAADPGKWEIYPMPLRDSLPTIPVPCRDGEGDVPLSLQPVIDLIYVEGGYEDDVDYSVPPRPPLSPADAVWAAELIANRSTGG